MKNPVTKVVYAVLPVFFLFALQFTYANAQTPTPPLLIDQLMYAKLPNLALESSDMVELNYGELTGTNSDTGTQWDIKLDTDASSYATGDFNNDGAQDIAATITASGGGSGDFYYLVLFTNNNGTPQYLAAQALGDRITVNKISYANGVFTADIITQGPNDPMCCGTLHEVLQYQLQNDTLTQVSSTAPTNNTSAPATTNSPIQSGSDAPASVPPSTNDSTDGWLTAIGAVVLVVIVRAVWANRSKGTTTNSGNNSQQQQSSQSHAKERRPQNDPEMRGIYTKVIHKYHPDFARSDEDKKFRTDLTAKLNKAYQEGDIATLRLFQ